MLDPGTVAALLLAVAGPVIELLEKAGVTRLTETTPVQKAAQRTGDSFSELEGCASALLTWADSAGFRELLSHLNEGNRDLGDERAVAQLFIDSSGFYYGDET